MKNKAILVSIIALFAIVLTLNAVMAASDVLSDIDYLSDVQVTVNDIVVGSSVAGFVSDNVPVEIQFTANFSGLLEDTTDDGIKESLGDAKVKVYIEGYKSEISDTTSRFHIVDGSTYLKRLSLELPSSLDLDESIEDLKLIVRISAKGEISYEKEYPITMQRDTYGLSVLSIDTEDKVAAGSVLALDIVIKNLGSDRLDDTYVKASIPELGISKRVYFGDISSIEDGTYDEIRDSLNKRVYLAIPADAISGIYNVEVEAYNYDAIVTASKRVIVSGIDASAEGEDVQDVDNADDAESNNAVLILTVILAIIFVVLLVVLIVLLTKRPAEVEEFGETSYY